VRGLQRARIFDISDFVPKAVESTLEQRLSGSSASSINPSPGELFSSSGIASVSSLTSSDSPRRLVLDPGTRMRLVEARDESSLAITCDLMVLPSTDPVSKRVRIVTEPLLARMHTPDSRQVLAKNHVHQRSAELPHCISHRKQVSVCV
jgi:hypothetical protein